MSRYGYSSHTMYSPGMDSSFIDHLLVRPHTSWRGTRGVRAQFGAEEDLEAELDALDAELDEEIFEADEVDDFGRLYRAPDTQFLEPASPGDAGAIIGRSGSSGLRGGRPVFGAKLEVLGMGSYEGNEIGVFAMSLGVLAIAGKALKVF